jgi:hypothetical protein
MNHIGVETFIPAYQRIFFNYLKNAFLIQVFNRSFKYIISKLNFYLPQHGHNAHKVFLGAL